MNQSAIDIEFLTESGADHYIDRTRVAEGVALKLTFVNPVCTPEIASALIHQIATRGELIAATQPRREAIDEQAGVPR